MSYFPEKSPQQAMLEAIENIQQEYVLTKEELVGVTLNALLASTDPCDFISDEVKKKRVS